MKFWAFRTQHCQDIVFAADVEAHKVARGLVGRWKSPEFYSAGVPGRRELMFQRTSPGGKGGLFYYQSEGGDRERDGARETLSHALCKRAVSELTHTTLRFRGQEVPIRILKSLSEQEVVIGGNRYRPDVSLTFESDSDHQVKWGGSVHVEVWHTHATGEQKAKDFFDAGYAMFEMRVSEKLQFTVAENVATAADMNRHVEWLKTLFKGWIGGKMLSDPKSREYLLAENKQLLKSLSQVKAEMASVVRELDQAKVSAEADQRRLAEERQTSAGYRTQISTLKEEAAQKAQGLVKLSVEKTHLADANAAAAETLFLWRLIGVTSSALLVFFVGWSLWHRFTS